MHFEDYYFQDTFLLGRIRDMKFAVSLLKSDNVSKDIIERLMNSEILEFNDYLHRTAINYDMDSVLKNTAEKIGLEKIINYGLVCYFSRISKTVETAAIFVYKYLYEPPQIIVSLANKKRGLFLTEELMNRHIKNSKRNAELYKYFLNIAKHRIELTESTKKIVNEITIKKMSEI